MHVRFQSPESLEGPRMCFELKALMGVDALTWERTRCQKVGSCVGISTTCQTPLSARDVGRQIPNASVAAGRES